MKSQTDGAGFQSYLVCKLHIRLYNIFIFYSISFYSPIFLLFIHDCRFQFNFFFLQYIIVFIFLYCSFLTGKEPLGGDTVNNKPLLLFFFLVLNTVPCESTYIHQQPTKQTYNSHTIHPMHSTIDPPLEHLIGQMITTQLTCFPSAIERRSRYVTLP